jgi:ketosteroid isomerase-like protein
VPLPELPAPIAAFLRAANRRDASALLKTLADDAVISDAGAEFRGKDLRRWSEGLFEAGDLAVRPINVTERDRKTVVTVIVDSARPGALAHVQHDWRFTIRPTGIAVLDIVETAEPDLPPCVAAFVRSTNALDLKGLVAVFAEDAVVNDDLREHWGKAAVSNWAEKDFIGQRVTIYVVKCVELDGRAVVTAHVDGDFDQRGLPYPLILTFYFSTRGDHIVQLIILHNQQT